MTRHATRGCRDPGSVTLELAILTPGVLILLGLAIVAGRITVAGAAVEQASAAAAREASLARSPTEARAAATRVATTSLSERNLRCAGMHVTVDTTGFATHVGNPAQVEATVTCTVPLAALAVPGLPGSRTLTSSTTSVLDRYRSR
jgi:Flp pilus assembly protein TadG